MTTFNIFDIKRFALHDGNGIRTTLFFKGCPLSCLWCQNPEGLDAHNSISYSSHQCIGCLECLKHSHKGEVTFENKKLKFHFEKGTDYQKLIDACPTGALSYVSQQYSIDDIVHLIERDKIFYQNSGGVTFSGGEPLMQGEKLILLAKALKEKGYHLAIETTLYAPLELIKRIEPYLDQIYVDIKIYDENEHIVNTGVSNQLILQNIHYLLEHDDQNKVIIRTPLIPHISDSEENIKNIGQFLKETKPTVPYELLNYNRLAPSKYEKVNKTFKLSKDLEPLSKERMNKLYSLLNDLGIKNIIKNN